MFDNLTFLQKILDVPPHSCLPQDAGVLPGPAERQLLSGPHRPRPAAAQGHKQGPQ